MIRFQLFTFEHGSRERKLVPQIFFRLFWYSQNSHGEQQNVNLSPVGSLSINIERQFFKITLHPCFVALRYSSTLTIAIH